MFWLPKPWVTFAGPECTQVQPQQWMNIPWAGSCLHFSHECLQGIIIAVRVGRFGVELLPGGGILCGDVGQFHIAGILLLILKVPEKKNMNNSTVSTWFTALGCHSGWVKVPMWTTQVRMGTREDAEICLFTVYCFGFFYCFLLYTVYIFVFIFVSLFVYSC